MVAFSIFVLGLAAICLRPELAILESKNRVLRRASFFKLTYQLFLYPRWLSPIKHIQTPSSRNWLTGNSDSFLLRTPYSLVHQWIKDLPHEGLLRYYLVGNLEWVMPISPDAFREILVTKVYDFEKPEIMSYGMRKTLGNGILLVEGESTRMREDNVIHISGWASRATLDIIGVAGMGCDFEALQRPGNELHQAYKTIVTQSLSDKLLFLLGVLSHPRYTMNTPTARLKEVKRCNRLIRKAAQTVIQQRMTQNSVPEAHVNIISVAMEGGAFTEKGLIDQAMTFLGAGHDTTAASLQWSIYALCKHPDVQLKLREEVRANFPSISSTALGNTIASVIDNLPYLNAFCNEVLRFYPAVSRTIRQAVRDTTIVGKFIPKGAMIVLSPKVINQMETLWGPDAGIFNPERFLGPGKANTGGATSNFANMKFLHGSRSCIAQNFAKGELACLVAAMYPDAELENEETVTIVPADGVLAKMSPLKEW
ncbi:hypothetical protein N7540_011882 [Penicillium herquei]|nr:hypothetical protein N7540_011882 [Penicillium herquei]